MSVNCFRGFVLFGVIASALPVAAQQSNGRGAQQSENPLTTILRGPRFTTTLIEPKEWVKRSRPEGEQAYIPVGRNADISRRRIMTPDEVRAKEAELNAVQAKHDRLGHRKPMRGAIGSAAAPPIRKKEAKKETCILTCDTGLGTTRRR